MLGTTRVALLLALTLGAQVPGDSGAGLVIRSTTALVEVRVAAADAHGKPVTDLQQEDFQIQDDRKPQPIAMFTADRGEAVPGSGTAPAPATSATPGGTGYAMVVIDWMNTGYKQRLDAQDAVVKLLKTYQPAQKVAVYLMAPDSGLVADFRDDMDIVAAAVSHLHPEQSGPAGGRGLLGLSLWDKRVHNSMRDLEKAGDKLARMPGRKSLIWMTAGFPLTIGDRRIEATYREHFEKLVNRLNRADVAVYTVDLTGLTMLEPPYLHVIQEMSERTGGTTFYDRNDFEEGIRLAFEDQKVGYTLAYRLPDRESLGAHEIRVKTTRKGVKLRYRESYQLVKSVR